jgi:peptidoglycan/xylan/chitin deacetylase (PgdA/CDA1 family)
LARLRQERRSPSCSSGYHAVTLDRVWQAWHGRARLPSKPVVLSFDDGYGGDFGTAMPVLRRRGWPGVLNLLVANLHRRVTGDRTPGWCSG